jgi:hypothetical protein
MQADTEGKPGSAFVETFANSPFGQDAEKGAIALEYACTSPDMDGACASLAAWPYEHGLRSACLYVHITEHWHLQGVKLTKANVKRDIRWCCNAANACG